MFSLLSGTALPKQCPCLVGLNEPIRPGFAGLAVPAASKV
jgi:hypothetical protein